MIFVAATLVVGSLGFTNEPDPAMLALGKKTKQYHKLNLGNYIKLGTWFDGNKHRVVDEALIVTPAYAARRFGYAIANTDFSEESLALEWASLKDKVGERPVVFLRLSRLCSVDFHDGDIASNGKPDALNRVQVWVQATDASWKSLELTPVQDVMERRPDWVLRDDLESVMAHYLPWPSKPTINELFSTIRWGKNRIVTWKTAFPPDFAPGQKSKFRIQEPDRTREIKFTMPTQ